MKAAHVIFIVALALLGYSLLEPYLISVVDVKVKDGRIPAAFSGKRAVFLTDIHCGPFLSVSRVRDIVERTNALQPDMIFLGGDYVTGGGDIVGPCVSELKNLKAPLGVFAVLGNHDNWADPKLTKNALGEAGIRVLDNKAAWIESGGARLRVGGVGDLWTESQDLKPTMESTTDDDYVILLSHNPQYAENTDMKGISLVLSGHTHGGQILPVRLLGPYLPSRLRQTYVSGEYEKGGTKIIVSNGIGMVFVPVRFMARPQIVVLTLEHQG